MTDDITVKPKSAELPLQTKAKAAGFIDRIDWSSLALELGHPVEKALFRKALWRLGIGATFLADHDIKVLVNVNPKLDRALAAIKTGCGFPRVRTTLYYY